MLRLDWRLAGKALAGFAALLVIVRSQRSAAFDLAVVGQYFPEWERELPRYLAPR